MSKDFQIDTETLKPYIPEGTAFDLEQAVNICREYQLSPVKRQIHFQMRWSNAENKKVMSHLITVDGFRAIAERSGRYEGQDGPYFCGTDGDWKDVWFGKAPPAAAKVGVYKAGFKAPLYAVALWESYKQTTKDGALTMMWQKMGTEMLAKCAESLALRRAFPDEFSGVYSREEMMQADSEAEPVTLAETRQSADDFKNLEKHKQEARALMDHIAHLIKQSQLPSEEVKWAIGMSKAELLVKAKQLPPADTIKLLEEALSSVIAHIESKNTPAGQTGLSLDIPKKEVIL